MKMFKIISKKSFLVTLIALVILACDKDFASVDSDIINQDTATNFNATSQKYDVISFTDALGPVQTNALPINMLGVFNDPTYGQTTASIVTQVNTALVNPSFGDNVVLDSVVLTIPYFSRNIGLTEENTINYALDSILPRGETYDDIKLSIFENNYFLRNFNPNGSFDAPQPFFSNRSASSNEQMSTADLEGTPIEYYKQDEPTVISADNRIKISNKAIVLTTPSSIPNAEPIITQRLAPSLRLKLKKTYWLNKILNKGGSTELSNANNFNDYFRGLYFKAEAINGSGSLIHLNLVQQTANVVLYYSRNSPTQQGETDQATYTLTFGPNRVNFLDNNYTLNLVDGNETEGDNRLFIKGGEGAIARINLFNGENKDDDNSNDNVFELWRKQFVNLDDQGNFTSSRRLVNEANLVFYVDQEATRGQEPDRIYLYNSLNSSPLTDYIFDSENNTLPIFSKPNHLGILRRDETTNKGIKYKMKITAHINDILIRNTQNVPLGLAVSGNVNLEGVFGQRMEQTAGDAQKNVPLSSLISSRGTVLHGNKSENLDKRLYLEIFYTCLETDIDCPQDN
jgi:hypothetical protein